MILIALGSNLSGIWGPPHAMVQHALAEMTAHNITVVKCSTLLTTAPFGKTDQPDFVNAVAEVASSLSAPQLLQTLHAIERQAGRERIERWGPRTLDLDIIDYHGTVTDSATSTIHLPHTGIAQRAFVLMPIAEIAPHWHHPISHKTAQQMLDELPKAIPG